jgi:hypothetical protein
MSSRADERSEMTEESSEERRMPPARIDHEFQQPMVEELPQGTSQFVREGVDATQEGTHRIIEADDDAT